MYYIDASEMERDPTEHILMHSGDLVLEHFGVKGMKWGIRKAKEVGSGIRRIAPKVGDRSWKILKGTGRVASKIGKGTVITTGLLGIVGGLAAAFFLNRGVGELNTSIEKEGGVQKLLDKNLGGFAYMPPSALDKMTDPAEKVSKGLSYVDRLLRSGSPLYNWIF